MKFNMIMRIIKRKFLNTFKDFDATFVVKKAKRHMYAHIRIITIIMI